MKNLFFAIAAVVLFSSCGLNRVQPNYEGVLMQNYGRNGIEDFKQVTGAQGILGPGSELYEVPMFETKGDPKEIQVTTNDGGVFTVDPLYAYQPERGKGREIVFHYRQAGLDNVENEMDHIEDLILNQRVINAYRDEARNYTTDSLMTHMKTFEKNVEDSLKAEFKRKYFQLNEVTSGLKPPTSMAQAIERRNNAIQQAEQVKNELQVERMQLEKAEIRKQRDLVQSAGLTPAILTQQWIEAIKESQNKIIITDGRTPVMLSNN